MDRDTKSVKLEAIMHTALASAYTRRRVLLDGMQELAARDVSCQGCSGVCCTFVANSMQITPLETLDILAHLATRGELSEERLQQWTQVVERHGLDRPAPGDGRRELVRRRYTCPFFSGGTLGCGLPQSVKPYGCLSFNPRRPHIREGEDCGVDGRLLEGRDADDRARQADTEMAPLLELLAGLEKRPIPAALLALAARLPEAIS